MCLECVINFNYTILNYSGVAKPGPTRALAWASAQLALASKLTKNHVINKTIASTRSC